MDGAMLVSTPDIKPQVNTVKKILTDYVRKLNGTRNNYDSSDKTV